MKNIIADEITYSTENINSFGGINFADLIIANISVYKTIYQSLGQRGMKAVYSYSDLFTADNYIYRAIMTNNCEMTDFEVVEFYNDRDESERLFDEMNNDFFGRKYHFYS